MALNEVPEFPQNFIDSKKHLCWKQPSVICSGVCFTSFWPLQTSTLDWLAPVLGDISRFQSTKNWPKKYFGAGEGADLEPFKRKEHTSVSYCVVLPAQLPSPPAKTERKHAWESSASCWLHPEAWSWQAERSLGSGGSLTAGVPSERKRQGKHNE